MQKVKEAFRAKLVADQTAGSLYDRLGGRIYADFAPQEEPDTLPYLVFNVTASPPDRFFGGAKSLLSTIEVRIFDDWRNGSNAVETIAETLVDLMDETDLAVTGFDRGLTVCENRGAETIEGERIVHTTIWTVEATEGL